MKTLGEDNKDKKLVDVKKLIVEFIGTFTLTYIGSWAIIYMDLKSITRNGVAFSTAFTLAGFTSFGLTISGAHFNPAITIAMIIVKRIEWTTALFYIISQFLGGLVGAGFIFIQMNADIMDKIKEKSIMGIPVPETSYAVISSMWGEVIGAFFLMYVYMATCGAERSKQYQSIGGPAVGFITYLVIMTIGEISGGGINPARSLGPAIIAGAIGDEQFVQLVGPIVGAALGAIVYTSVFIDDEEDLKNAEYEKKLKAEQEAAEHNEREIELQ